MSQCFLVALLHCVAQAEVKEITDITIQSLNMRDELESAFCHPCTNWNSSSEGRLEDPNDNDEGIHPHPDRLLLTGTSEHQSLINKSVCLCWDHLCRLRTFLKQKWSQIVRAYFNKITFLTIKWYGSNYFTRPMYQLDSSMNMVKEWYMSCRELPRNSDFCLHH